MDEREQLQASIERTQEALAQKAHLLEQRVVDVKEHVAHALDVRGQYHERPWPFVITAMVTGVVTGAWWSSGASARHALGHD
jgi:ElaB/YqjD/DUF883 family membrane-anchored ribosome-binding protein